MPRAIAEFSVQELDNLIRNHESRGKTNERLYLDAMLERSMRKGKGLDFHKSKKLILSAAAQGHFLSYKQLSDGSGAYWGQVHYSIGNHLWELVRYAHGMGWPMLSAIVVNAPNVATGKMEPDTLRGFIKAAEELGRIIDVSPEIFLSREQEKVFEWARLSR